MSKPNAVAPRTDAYDPLITQVVHQDDEGSVHMLFIRRSGRAINAFVHWSNPMLMRRRSCQSEETQS